MVPSAQASDTVAAPGGRSGAGGTVPSGPTHGCGWGMCGTYSWKPATIRDLERAPSWGQVPAVSPAGGGGGGWWIHAQGHR